MRAFLGVIFAAGVGVGWTLALAPIAANPSSTGQLAALAAGVGLIVARAALRPMEFVNTLGHEISHAIATILTGGSVSRLTASDDEGGVIHHRGGWNFFVALAPYAVPWLAFLIAIVDGVYGRGEVSSWGAGAIGAACGWHLLTATDDMRRNVQSLAHSPNHRNDATQMGGVVSALIWMTVVNVIFIGALLAFANGGLGGVTELGVAFWRTEIELWDAVRGAVGRGWTFVGGAE